MGPTNTGKVHVGVLKSFNEMNNYGFISCDEVHAEHGSDTFVHGKMLQHLSCAPGTRLEFDLGISAKGQPQAMNIRFEGQPCPEPSHEDEPEAKKARILAS